MQLIQQRAASGLEVFRDPASVAVVGASSDPAKWGYWLASGALRGKHRRRVHLVNRRATDILGEPCRAALGDLPEVPELVALCVPAAHVADVVDEGLRLGVRGFLGITAGVPDEPALVQRITAHGARLLGTNSLGIFDASTELQLMWGSPTPGPLAVVSQSGQLGSELAELGRRHGVGISRFVSIGNQSDVTATELLADLIDDDSTRAVAVYLESFSGGQALFDALARLTSAGKPTVLLTVGASSASTRLAHSHTGSLTSPQDIVDAACRRAAVIRANTPGEVIDIVRTALSAPRPRGRRVAIIGDSGGQSGIAADVAAAAGLDVVAFSDTLAEGLSGRLPAGAAYSNPVDLAGAGEADLDTYAAIARTVVESGEVDGVVLTGYFGCYGRDIPSLAEAETAVAQRIGELAHGSGLPVVAHTMGERTATADALWRSGVPAFGRIESAVRGISALATPGRRDVTRAGGVVSSAELKPGYWSARALLAEVGVEFPAAQVVHSREDVIVAARRLSAPFVLKVGWLDHKSEVGGVVTNLTDAAQLTRTFDDMRHRLGPGDYLVEEQDTRPDAVEILVGARRDPALGAVVVVGAGGTETELLRDVAVEMAPVSPTEAIAMLSRLRCAPMLAGWRGKPPVDTEALAELVATVSHLIIERPDIDEIELNPVRVTPTGPLAVDALAVRRNDAAAQRSNP